MKNSKVVTKKISIWIMASISSETIILYASIESMFPDHANPRFREMKTVAQK